MKKMRQLVFSSLFFILVAALISSCSKDDDNTSTDSSTSTVAGCYVLNSGRYGSNNATLSFYNTDKDSVSTSVFSTSNSFNLGDTGEDMIVYGGKMYIAMYGSGLIYVTDKNGKFIQQIEQSNSGELQQPRQLAASGNYVYVTYYDGYVGRIDTTSYAVTEVKVGDNPEGIAVSNGKIYVANSGGMNYPDYGSTVSVIDASTFTVTKELSVVINPDNLLADGNGNVFLISNGNYGTVLNTLQRINSDDTVDSLSSATYMALSADKTKLYYIYAQYGSTSFDFKTYDISSETIESSSFASSTVISTLTSPAPYCMSVNPTDGNVYVGVSDYKTEGKVYIINPSTGNLVTSFASGGINPIAIRFLDED